MRTTKTRHVARPSTSSLWRFNSVAAAVAVAMGGLAALPGQAFAAAPNAGANITNIATADYTDATAAPRTTQSNPVTTVVRQVASFTLTADNNVFVSPGGQVTYPHTLTNTGNGTDTFRLSVVNAGGDAFDLNSLAIYADSNGDGVPDNTINLNGTDVSLARNGVFTFVVVGTAPSTGLLNGDDSVATVTADSRVFQGSVTDVDPANISNTDTAVVTADAVIGVTKGANLTTGPTGTVVEYTLTYKNTGNNTATNVTLEDVIPDPYAADPTAGMVFDANGYGVGAGGMWSGSATALTNADDGVEAAGVQFKYDAVTKKVTAVIPSVGPNVTGTIKFRVVVGGTTPPGVMTNTAQYTYDPDGAGVKTAIGPTNTNDQPFTVTQSYLVAANDSTTVNSTGGVNDIVEVASANPGDVVTFNNEIWNNGNGTDTFNITLSGSNFPTGTTFQIYKSDGTTPLVTTDSDGTADTGPVAAGARYTVVVKATLPPNASGTGPFTTTVTATSSTGLTTDTVTDELTSLTAATVDLTNNAAIGAPGVLGTGAGTNTALVTTAVNPGASANFTLVVNNTSANADNYDLQVGADNTFTSGLPAGWTVVFHSGTCTGPVVTNTGSINAGANAVICAVVTSPASATPGTTNAFFRSVSPVSGASDYKVDAVTVNTVRNISITSDGSNQVAPGGSVTYVHVVTNLGNVTEGDAAGEVVLTGVNGTAGFTTTLYYDANNNGTVDPGEVVIGDLSAFTTNGGLGLNPGESIHVIAKVTAPPTATDGQFDVATIAATTTGTVNTVAAPPVVSNLDTSTVFDGQIRLVKNQALDAACDGTEDAAFTAAGLQALPGECIIYRIVATNEGSAGVTNVSISDSTPTYTKLNVAVAPSTTKGAFNNAASLVNGYTGTVSVNVGPMSGSEVVTVKFGVKVDN